MKKLGCLLLLGAGLVFGQASGPSVFLPGLPPGGIGGVCINPNFFGYLTGAGQVVTCVAGLWTVGGGGGGTVTSTQQLSDFQTVKTSGTVLTTGAGCAPTTPCVVRKGDGAIQVVAPATTTLVSGTGNVFVSIDMGAGTLFCVGVAGISITGSGCTPSVGTTFLAGTTPIYRWSATGGVWDTSGGADFRAFFSTQKTFSYGSCGSYTETTTTICIPSAALAIGTTPISGSTANSLLYVDGSGVLQNTLGGPPGSATVHNNTIVTQIVTDLSNVHYQLGDGTSGVPAGLVVNSADMVAFSSGAVFNTVDTPMSRNAAGVICAGFGSSANCLGAWKAATFLTNTNCSSSAAPAVCGSASAGSVVVAAAATTVTVNTTAVTANSQVILTFDSSLGTKLGVTCNTTQSLSGISARVAATSFTITTTAPVANPACFSYEIKN